VEHYHLLGDHSVLRLPTIDNHRPLVSNGCVVLTRANANTFGLEDIDRLIDHIVLEDLVCALANLSLPIKLEAAPKHIDLILVRNCSVALAALNHFLRTKVHFFPQDNVALNLPFDDLLDGLTVHASNHVGMVSNRSYGGRLTRGRHPWLTLDLHSHLSSKSLTFLHTLDEGLNASGQLLG